MSHRLVIYNDPSLSSKPIEAVIQNVVCTYTLNLSETDENYISINHILTKLAYLGPQYNPKRFPAVILRFVSDIRKYETYYPKVSLLIFSNTKIVCTGARSIIESVTMLNKMKEILEEIGYKEVLNLRSHDYNGIQNDNGINIQNIVASCDLPYCINLKEFHAENKSVCDYNPEKFPGAIIKEISFGRVTVLIFDKGSLVITGAQKYITILECLRHVINIARPYFYNKINNLDEPGVNIYNSNKLIERITKNTPLSVKLKGKVIKLNYKEDEEKKKESSDDDLSSEDDVSSSEDELVKDIEQMLMDKSI